MSIRELPFFATWKSMKAFKRTGKVEVHSPSKFYEYIFEEDRTLKIHSVSEGKKKLLATSDKWKVELQNKRHILTIPEMRAQLEVITINHTVMVLLDLSSDEKIFFTKDTYWEAALQNTQQISM